MILFGLNYDFFLVPFLSLIFLLKFVEHLVLSLRESNGDIQQMSTTGISWTR